MEQGIARRIKDIAPAARVVILTIHDAAAYRMDAAEAGVSVYVLKNEIQAQFVLTMRALLANHELEGDRFPGVDWLWMVGAASNMRGMNCQSAPSRHTEIRASG